VSVCTWAAQRVQQWLGQHTCDTLSSSWARWRPSKACLKLSFFQQMLRLHHPVSVPKNVGSQVLGSSSLATLWTPVCLKLAPVPIETHMSSGLILLNVALARTTSVFTVWVVLCSFLQPFRTASDTSGRTTDPPDQAHLQTQCHVYQNGNAIQAKYACFLWWGKHSNWKNESSNTNCLHGWKVTFWTLGPHTYSKVTE